MSDADWKLLYEFVFLTAFRKRKLLATRKGCKKNVDLEAPQAEVSVSVPERENWGELSDAERRSILKSICINSLLNNPKIIAFPVIIPINGSTGRKLSTKQVIKPINIVKIQ